MHLHTRRWLFPAMLAAVAVATIAGAPPAKAPARASSTRFLPAGIDWKAVVGPPPAAGSCEALADMAVVKFEQLRRSPAEIDNSWRGVLLEPATFDQPLNARFDAEVAPKLTALLRQAIEEARAENGVLKRFYDRPRPFDADPEVTPVVPKEEGRSYPSSHAMRGLLTALLLAEVFPERREALVTFGRQAGYSRVVGGVHFPSDVQAGFRLAERAASEIIRSDAWRRDLAGAANEVTSMRAAMVPGG